MDTKPKGGAEAAPNGPKKLTVQAADVPMTDPKGVQSEYCNNIQFAISNWDIRLVCSEILPGPSGTPVQVLKANLVMTVEHADALLKALKTALETIAREREKAASAKPAEKV